MLTLVATGVVANVLSQVFNGSAIEDKLRGGPAILSDEMLVYVNGPAVPTTVVIPGGFHPAASLLQKMARPIGSTAPEFLKVEHSEGVQVGDLFIELVLTGNRNQLVRILNIQPVQLRRDPPLGGAYFDIGSQGVEDNIKIDINLDRPFPVAVGMVNNQPSSTPYFRDHSISLNKGEQVVLLIDASATCYDARFDLAITYMVGSATGTQVVTNGGNPFQVTGPRTDMLSYRQVFALRNNYGVTQDSRLEIERTYRQIAGQPSCPS